MKKLLLLCSLLSFLYFSSFAQVADWAIKEQGTGLSICNDGFQNSFVVSSFQGTIAVGSNSYTSLGGNDVLVCKYDPTGVLLWSLTMGGTGAEYPSSIAFDGVGNVWVTGDFAANFIVGSSNFTTLGGTDAFIVEIDAASGMVVNAMQGGGTGNDNGSGVASDGAGNVFLAGTCNSNVSFGSTTITATSYDCFIVKFDQSFTPVWGIPIHGTNIESMWTMTADNSGNVYVAGFSTSANTTFGTSTITNPNPTGDHFIVKFNTAGVMQWVAHSNYNGENYGLAIDGSGNVYFTGNFDTTGQFGPTTLTGNGMDDFIVCKLSSSGTWLWAENFGGTGNDDGYTLAVDPAGDVFVGGDYTGSITFGTIVLNSGGHCIVKLDPLGAPVWGISTSAWPRGLSYAGNSTVYACGYFATSCTFGSITLYDPFATFNVRLSDNANVLRGTVFHDINNDASNNTGDTPFPNVIVQLAPGNTYCNSGLNGIYDAFAASGTYTATVPNVPLYHTLTTAASQTATFAGMGAIDSLNDFGFYPTPGMNDLRVTITALTIPKQGYALEYRITYENVGTTTQNADIQLNFSNILSYVMSAPTATSVNGNTVDWNIGSLAPSAFGDLTVLFNVPTNAVIGDMITSTVNITPVAGDQVTADNTSTDSRVVIASWDPNMKEVTPPADITPAQVTAGQWMTYTIHFQNTGNDTAHTVIVRDALSSNLNIPTFEILSSSHPVIWNLSGPGNIEFRFENIMLPDSGANEVASCGFVKYRVKAKTTLVLGDIISNTAGIFFDYNPVVNTNTVSTHVGYATGINQVETSFTDFNIYPNPATDMINLYIHSTETGSSKASIVSVTGEVVWTNTFEMGSKPIEVKIPTSHIASGIYMVKIENVTGIKTGKLVIR